MNSPPASSGVSKYNSLAVIARNGVTKVDAALAPL